MTKIGSSSRQATLSETCFEFALNGSTEASAEAAAAASCEASAEALTEVPSLVLSPSK